jgi:hypothetical protein
MMGGVTQPDDLADTRMMGIVHSALRRDLVRARLVLQEPAPLTGERRTTLADHVRWLLLWGGTPAAAVPSLSVDEYPRYAA